MAKKWIQLRDITGVAASGTALINIPIGAGKRALRYHRILMQHGFAAGTNTIAGAMTNMSEIRVKRNTRVQRIFSATQLRDYNVKQGSVNSTSSGTGVSSYDCTGVPNTAPGVGLTLFFGEPWREEERGKDFGAWSTSQSTGWESLTIEVDLGAASTPTLIAWAQVDEELNTNDIVKFQRYKIPSVGVAFDWILAGRKDWFQAISFYPDSGGSNAASQVTMKLQGDIKEEPSASSLLNRLQGSQMTPAAVGRTSNIFDLDFDHDGNLNGAWDLSVWGDPTFTIAAASAMSGTITAIATTLGKFD